MALDFFAFFTAFFFPEILTGKVHFWEMKFQTVEIYIIFIEL